MSNVAQADLDFKLVGFFTRTA